MKTWTIRRVPRTANQTLRSHWAVRRRDKQSWRRHVRKACGRPRRRVRGRVRLEITVHRHSRQDPDNAYASCKYLIDALVREGWLADDSPEHLSLHVTERIERRRSKRRTDIRWIPASP